MGKKGGDRHLKSLTSPTYWPTPRKPPVWATKPSPGPHPLLRSIPLRVLVRDALHLAGSRREADIIITAGKVRVDGRPRRDVKFPIGLMDVLEVPDAGVAYRILPGDGKPLILHAIEGEERSFKLCRLEGKSAVAEGGLQLNLHDGRNYLSTPEEADLHTLDVIRLDLDDLKIQGHLPLKEGMYAILIGGKNVGRHGVVERIEKPSPLASRIAKIRSPTGEEYESVVDYVFTIGEGAPTISLPGT